MGAQAAPVIMDPHGARAHQCLNKHGVREAASIACSATCFLSSNCVSGPSAAVMARGALDCAIPHLSSADLSSAALTRCPVKEQIAAIAHALTDTTYPFPTNLRRAAKERKSKCADRG